MEKQTEESNILGYLSTRFRVIGFFRRSMGQIFPVRSYSIIQNRINERFLIVFGIHAIFTRPMNTYSISTWWIIESFVISLHEYFMRNFIGDFWLNFVAVLEKHIIKVYSIKKKKKKKEISTMKVKMMLRYRNTSAKE